MGLVPDEPLRGIPGGKASRGGASAARLPRTLRWITILVPILFLQGLRWLSGSPLSWRGLAVATALVLAALLVAHSARPRGLDGHVYAWPWAAVAMLAAGLVAAAVYLLSRSTVAVWALLAIFYGLLLALDGMLAHRRHAVWRWGIRGVLCAVAGLAPVAALEIETHFVDEEFFVALQALGLALAWGLLWLAARAIGGRPIMAEERGGLRVDRRWLVLALVVLAGAGLSVTIRSYQQSFFPTRAPSYPGITASSPFLCGQLQPAASPTYNGQDVFDGILKRVAANPQKAAPEYGMLALGTGERIWAAQFRTAILNEAAQGLFTGPMHSVKFPQYDAALRAYYLPRVRARFPDLFTRDDLAVLQQWFANINHRALTVEWVDWMYAMALSKTPEGPYENQEIGAGLLAVLEASGLAAPDRSAANQAYLARNPGGWAMRFRNTDDAFPYQPEWINNAYYQSLYTGKLPLAEARLSFEWLLAQALPDGAAPTYNFPAQPSLAAVAYLGARLTQDPRYLWIAGQALAYAEAHGDVLAAQPGVEEPLQMTAPAPDTGSCLLYGDSGLPTQVGPLAPDKVVLRDGWSADSAYLMLNLRFTGWHRYKGTNTVTLAYQGAALAGDVEEGQPFKWLPTGRQIFRDKRVPRENFNGLLVEKAGLSAILYELTGFGGPWAQDPPYYADIVAFAPKSDVDYVHTRLSGWQGWQQDRQIYFYHHDGPIVILDDASGPASSQAALAWHLSGAANAVGTGRYLLHGENGPVEAVLLPVNDTGTATGVSSEQDATNQGILYTSPDGGQVHAAMVFLPGKWAGAGTAIDAQERVLHITQGAETITVPLGAALEAAK